MRPPEAPAPHYRVALLASDTSLARQTLEGLVAGGMAPVAVVAEQRSPTAGQRLIPVRVTDNPEGLEEMAARHRLSVIHEPAPGQATLADTLRQLEPDILLVACYPRKLATSALQTAAVATLNLHPSLLPAYRGPQPLFWQRRAGLVRVGMTLHAVDEGLDSGAIWRQAACPLPDGIDFPTANRRLGGLGAELLGAALAEHRAGRLIPQPQDSGRASYQGTPQMEHFRLSTGWPARRAFNFIRMAACWGLPFPVTAGGRTLLLSEALGFRPDADLASPFRIDGEEAAVQFSPGVLHARIRPT